MNEFGFVLRQVWRFGSAARVFATVALFDFRSVGREKSGPLFPFRALFRAGEYTLTLEMLRCVMRRRQVNRNFTKPGSRQIVFSANSFEQMVKTLNISPEEYRSSLALKEWVRQNKDQRYVPPELLEAFGFQVDVESG